MRSKFFAACFVLIYTTLTAVSPVGAGDDDAVYEVNPSATTANNTLRAEITATREIAPVSGLGVADWVLDCTWFQLPATELPAYLTGTGGAGNIPADTIDDPEQPWSIVECTGIGTLNFWPTGDPLPDNIRDWLVARARAAVAFPIQIGQAAPFGDNNAPLITQLPTWLWIDETVWTPISATPTPVFGHTATATATPTNVTFAANTGETIDCGPNLGPPFNFSLPDNAQTSPCTLTYRHSSAINDWTLTTTITWAITWTCTPTCGTGTLANQTITTTRPVRVAEYQALNIAPNN